LRGEERPTLNFLHILLPHAPYEYLPSGSNHVSDPGWFNSIGTRAVAGKRDRRRSDDPLVVAHNQQLYLLQVGYVDHLIGRLVERLKTVGLYDRCLLVIVADHGVAFRPGEPARDATRANYPDIMSVPLIIKAPGQKQGHISDRNVESIDLLPTMAGNLGIRLPWKTDGISAADNDLAPRKRKVLDRLQGSKMTCDAAFLEKDSSLLQMLTWFGSGSKPEGLYRIGPHVDLIGKQLSELDVAGQSVVEVEFQRPDVLDDFQPGAGYAPCVIQGSVDSGAVSVGPVKLAVALNGTVQAVTRTYTSIGQENQWSAVLSETALQRGHNDLQLFVIRGAAGQLTLEPVAILEEP
jgi:hypothetical protein